MRKLQELYFVTSNKKKAQEAEAILDFPIKTIALDIEEIQDIDLEKIAAHKATAAFNILKKPLLVDDVGLFIEVWNGFPGPFVKWIVESGEDVFLRMLACEKKRDAVGKAVIGFHDGEQVHTFVGEVKGSIAQEKLGEGWGWDPIFIPEGQTQTYAQMGIEKKNILSHRRKALDSLKEHLVKNAYINGV